MRVWKLSTQLGLIVMLWACDGTTAEEELSVRNGQGNSPLIGPTTGGQQAGQRPAGEQNVPIDDTRFQSTENPGNEAQAAHSADEQSADEQSDQAVDGDRDNSGSQRTNTPVAMPMRDTSESMHITGGHDATTDIDDAPEGDGQNTPASADSSSEVHEVNEQGGSTMTTMDASDREEDTSDASTSANMTEGDDAGGRFDHVSGPCCRGGTFEAVDDGLDLTIKIDACPALVGCEVNGVVNDCYTNHGSLVLQWDQGYTELNFPFECQDEMFLARLTSRSSRITLRRTALCANYNGQNCQ